MIFRGTNILISTLLIMASSFASAAVEIEFVPQEAIKGLIDEFEASNLKLSQDAISGEWSCDLYGVQSRLQVKRGVALYHFSSAHRNFVENEGALPVKTYELNSQGALRTYVGSKDGLRDEIRLSSSGALLTKLSSLKDKKARIIALSRCRKKV